MFPSVARMNFGKAVERLTAAAVENDPVLSKVVQHLGGSYQPDFVGVASSVARGMNFDVTTVRQVAAHLSRAGYGDGLNVLTYARDAAFKLFP